MLGVLAIIGVLSVGGIAGYSKAMHKYRINKTIEQITLIAGNIRAFFAPQGNYNGLDYCSTDTPTCILIKKAKLIPEDMWGYNTDGVFNGFYNVFGQNVYIRSSHKAKTHDLKAFEIRYNIEKDYEVCIELLTHDWTAAGIKGIDVSHGPRTSHVTVPVSIDTAADKCSGDLYYIVFFFDVNSNCWNETSGNTCS